MSLLPPFSYSPDVKGAVETIEEELDTLFHGLGNSPVINYNSLSFKNGKKMMLGLRPELPANLTYAQELARDILEENDINFKVRSNKDFFKCELPLGRFDSEFLFETAIDCAKEEFILPLSLFPKSIVLFEKGPNHWPIIKKLYNFDNPMSSMYGERPAYELRENNF